MASHVTFKMLSVFMLVIISTIGLTSGHPNEVKEFAIGESLVNARDSVVGANPAFNVELVARSDIPTVTVTENECGTATTHLPGTSVTAPASSESTATATTTTTAKTGSGSQPSVAPSSPTKSASASSVSGSSTESASAVSSQTTESATTTEVSSTGATGSGTAAPSSSLHHNAAHRLLDHAATRIVVLVALVTLFAVWVNA